MKLLDLTVITLSSSKTIGPLLVILDSGLLKIADIPNPTSEVNQTLLTLNSHM